LLVALCAFLKLRTRWIEAWRTSMIFGQLDACNQILRSLDLAIAIMVCYIVELSVIVKYTVAYATLNIDCIFQ
jgi:hypothetical protein